MNHFFIQLYKLIIQSTKNNIRIIYKNFIHIDICNKNINPYGSSIRVMI